MSFSRKIRVQLATAISFTLVLIVGSPSKLEATQEIFDGLPVDGLDIKAEEVQNFQILVPEDLIALKVSLRGNQSYSARFQVEKEQSSASENYRCEGNSGYTSSGDPEVSGRDKLCLVPFPEPGLYRIIASATSDAVDLSLKAVFVRSVDVPVLEEEVSVAVTLEDPFDIAIYAFDIGEGFDLVRVSLSDTIGQVYVQSGRPTDGLNADCSGTSTLELSVFCALEQPHPGRYYASFRNDYWEAEVDIWFDSIRMGDIPEIANGGSVVLDSSFRGQYSYFKVTLPPGAKALEVEAEGDNGDADLFLDYAALPRFWRNAPAEDLVYCASIGGRSTERCKIPKPDSGEYYVAIRASEVFTQVQVKVSFLVPEVPGPEPVPVEQISSRETIGPLDLSGKGQLVFNATLPAASSNLVVNTFGGSGDIDLYVTCGEVPSQLRQHSCRSEGATNRETCHLAKIYSNECHVVIHGFRPSSGFFLTMRFSENDMPPQAVWLPEQNLPYDVWFHTVSNFTNGDMLLVGSQSSNKDGDSSVRNWLTGEWRPTRHGVRGSKRYQHSATPLLSGDLLVVGGGSTHTEIFRREAEIWDAVWGLEFGWRDSHTATRLRTGDVLVAGGCADPFDDELGYLSSSAVFDSRNEIWVAVDPLSVPRTEHAATLLPSGKVLVTGGRTRNAIREQEFYSNSVEEFDPLTAKWTVRAPMNFARASHVSTYMGDGKILVVGGDNKDGSASGTAEVFDLTTGTWTLVEPPLTRSFRHSGVLLPTGEVLIVSYPSAIYNPDLDEWKPVLGEVQPFTDPTVTLSGWGEIYVAGGWTSSRAATLVYNPAVEFREEFMNVPRTNHSVTRLRNGEVLTTGGRLYGSTEETVEIYSPASGIWRLITAPEYLLDDSTATMLHDGRVLVVGLEGPYENSALIFEPQSETWRLIEGPRHQRRSHTSNILPDGRVLVAGGRNVRKEYFTEIFDPSTETWRLGPSSARQRYRHATTLLNSGLLLVTGGGTSIVEILNPSEEESRISSSLSISRDGHTASLLPTGEVLVVGGENDASLFSCEIFDPRTETWRPTGSLNHRRDNHRSVLLPDGRVATFGGFDSVDFFWVEEVEIFDLSTESWIVVPEISVTREGHSITVFGAEKIMMAGGNGGTTWVEHYFLTQLHSEFAPVIADAPEHLSFGESIQIEGVGFAGVTGGGSGKVNQSPSNVPFVWIWNWDNLYSATLEASITSVDSPDLNTIRIDELPPTLHPGPHYLAVVSNGVPSEPVRVDVVCSLEIDGPPDDQSVSLGTPATFEVSSQGGRIYQWYKNGERIDGATDATYTTPPTGIESAGDQYTVRVGTGCMEDDAPPATLRLLDDKPPVASVALPRGGEYWLLSPDSGPPNVETVAWDMTDDIRLCGADVRLVYSLDGGQTYQAAPNDAGLPRSFGAEGLCPHPGLNVTNLEYEVPTEPPAGVAGALYKIELTVTDHAGLTSVARSSKPFFIVEPNPELVKTLILTHPPRLASELGWSDTQLAELGDRLQELAAHPRVQGRVIDLANVPTLEAQFDAWDNDTSSVEKANAILFGTGGLHEYLLELQKTFTEIESILLVGDDRVIPMARILDRTALPESAYTQGEDLTPTRSSVGQALARDHFLSDDLLGVERPISVPWTAEETDLGVFLPEIAVGRLVETFEDISTTIATFISRDGVVDLDASDPVLGRKVLVTAYDFLIDSGRRIRDRWKASLGLPEPFIDTETTPVHGRLVSETWGEATIDQRRDALREALGGLGDEPYAIVSLNGHATHYEEGVPGTSAIDIQGVPALDLYGVDACFEPSSGPLRLEGSVIYAVGCHGALPVPGSCSTDIDNSLDLPQTFLRSGALAYVANTGYGWGLVSGIGYSERLMELFTEEMTQPGTTTVGRLAQRAKLRYFQESPRLDPYDLKTLLQWNIFGLPMTTIKRAAGNSVAPEAPGDSPAPTKGEMIRRAAEASTPYRVEPSFEEPGRTALPANLTQLNLHFDLSGPGVYRKYDASSRRLPADEAGCPSPAPGDPPGCFYTLNGISEQGTGATDLPIQPFLIYDSRLSGTSQHGVVWMGGEYEQEREWTPVVAELASNDGDFSDNNLGPRLIRLRPKPRRRPTTDDHLCRPSDLDTASLLMVTGETLKDHPEASTYNLQRLYREIDLEVLYFNDQGQGGNCDRSGPTFEEAPGGYHVVNGAGIEWNVRVSDEAGVWRVVVLYDLGADALGRGRWIPLELSEDGAGAWTGELRVGGASELVYLVQAIDRRGNVSWMEFETVDLPASGVPHDLVASTWVTFAEANADLALVDGQATPDPIVASGRLALEGSVENLGPDEATEVLLTAYMADGMVFEAANAGWACGVDPGTVACRRSTPIASGDRADWLLFVRAPAAEGLATTLVEVSGLEEDIDRSNNVATLATQVLSGADLAITKVHDRGVVAPGESLGYTIAVTNHGPEDVYGAIVQDAFPLELENITWACVSTLGSRCTVAGSNHLFDSVDLLSGGSVIYSVNATVGLQHEGTVVNRATVESPNPALDGNPANNSAAVATIAAPEGTLIFIDGFESGGLELWTSFQEVATREGPDSL